MVKRSKTLHVILFSTGRNRNQAEDEATVQRVVGMHVGEFSLFAGKGYWKGEGELSFQLLLAADDCQTVNAIIETLEATFDQESIVEIRHDAASVIYHQRIPPVGNPSALE